MDRKYKTTLIGIIGIICILVWSSILAIPSYAHPGRTASDGCHYCRTNCDKWGVAWNRRHCHGRTSISTTLKTTYCEEDNIWATLALGKQECGYDLGSFISGWGLVYGVIGLIIYSVTKKKD